MNIYLIRHGEAVAKEIDPMQPLSEAGIRSVQKIAEFLAKTEIKLQQIFHSGKPRAQQTAAIIAKKISKVVDELVVLDMPINFFAVGQFFQDFSQVSDEEVIECLKNFKNH